jgi:peptidyl-dipeptidase Dcp
MPRSPLILIYFIILALNIITTASFYLSSKSRVLNQFLLPKKTLFSFALKSSLKTKKMTDLIDNPLVMPWTTKHEVPPFAKIQHNHYEDALKIGMKKQLEEIEAIANIPITDSTFDNVIAVFDRSGSLFSRVCGVFHNLCASDCPPELQAVQLKMAGPLAAHSNAIYMYPGLFSRIDHVYQNRLSSSWALNSEQIRLVERLRLDFVRAGANFDEETQKKYAKITEKLAELETVFSQNILGDESSYTIVLKKDDLSGVPDSVIDAAKQAAIERNLGADDYVITLSRSLVEPFITYSDRRDLRERAW